jgi:hypothetical protein
MIAAALLLVASVSTPLTQDLETLGGAPFSLESALARGPVVMVFWNSWLPESTASIPVIRDIERAAQEHGWPGVIVVFQDESNAARDVLSHEGARLPTVMDRRGALLRRFQVTRAPSLLVIDRGGQVLSRSGLDPAQVRAVLKSLADRPVPLR